MKGDSSTVRVAVKKLAHELAKTFCRDELNQRYIENRIASVIRAVAVKGKESGR